MLNLAGSPARRLAPCLVCMACCAPQPAHAQRCTYGEWTRPVPIAGSNRDVVARNPAIVAMGARRYVVGNNVPLYDKAPLAASVFSAWEIAGRSIGAPGGQYLFGYPRVARLGNGTMMMLWGEPDSLSLGARENWGDQRLTQVWWAMYDPASGWSAASKLYEDGRVWADASATEPVVSSDGALHMALPMVHSLRYVRWSHGAWLIADVPHVGGTAYTSIAVDDAARVITIAYMGTVSNAGLDRNSVFIVRSEDDGTSWSPPQLVSRSGRTPAFEVQARMGPDHELHLVWMQDTTGDLTPELIRHVSSRDGGHTWSAPADVRPPEGFRALNTTMDGCGTLHAIYEDWHGGGTTGDIDYLRFVNGHWEATQHLFSPSVSVSATIGMTGDEVLIVALFRRGVRGRPGYTFVSKYSRLSIRSHAASTPTGNEPKHRER